MFEWSLAHKCYWSFVVYFFYSVGYTKQVIDKENSTATVLLIHLSNQKCCKAVCRKQIRSRKWFELSHVRFITCSSYQMFELSRVNYFIWFIKLWVTYHTVCVFIKHITIIIIYIFPLQVQDQVNNVEQCIVPNLRISVRYARLRYCYVKYTFFSLKVINFSQNIVISD